MSASLSALREGRADLASIRELSSSTLSREDRRAALSACIKMIGSGKVTDGKEDRKTLRMLLYFVESLSALECKELSLPAPGGMLAHLVVGQEGPSEGSSHVAADICELAKSQEADAQLLRSKLVEPAMRALAKGGACTCTVSLAAVSFERLAPRLTAFPSHTECRRAVSHTPSSQERCLTHAGSPLCDGRRQDTAMVGPLASAGGRGSRRRESGAGQGRLWCVCLLRCFYDFVLTYKLECVQIVVLIIMFLS